MERLVHPDGLGQHLFDSGVLDRLALEPLTEVAGGGVLAAHHQAARGHDGQHLGHEAVVVAAETFEVLQQVLGVGDGRGLKLPGHTQELVVLFGPGRDGRLELAPEPGALGRLRECLENRLGRHVSFASGLDVGVLPGAVLRFQVGVEQGAHGDSGRFHVFFDSQKGRDPRQAHPGHVVDPGRKPADAPPAGGPDPERDQRHDREARDELVGDPDLTEHEPSPFPIECSERGRRGGRGRRKAAKDRVEREGRDRARSMSPFSLLSAVRRLCLRGKAPWRGRGGEGEVPGAGGFSVQRLTPPRRGFMSR